MKLLKQNPITPGTRHQIKLQKNLLATNYAIDKNLAIGYHSYNGKSSITGHTTVWHKGGGCKKLFRLINFKNQEHKSIVISINYDPYRSAFIALAFNLITKSFFYTVAAHSLFPGSLILCQEQLSEFFYGYRTKLLHLPPGALLYNLSLTSKSIAKYSRAAGTFCQLIQKNLYNAKIRIPSGKIIILNSDCYATLGRVSNLKNNLIVKGKAGRNILKGIKSIVRGVAMNPVDHPHGGRTKGGRPSVTPWGILTKGQPTVKKKKKYE